MGFKQTLFPLSIIALLFAASCTRDNIGKPLQTSGESFSIEDQNIIGDRISEAILDNPADFPILDKIQKQEAYDYLQNNILEVIVRSPTMTKWKDFDWKVNIIDLDDKYHAFFLPNGEFFIHVGLLKDEYVNNDARLLGIVAHELAYIEKDLILKKLKEEFNPIVLSALADGTTVDDSELKEMALFFNGIEFESNEVLYADSFAVASICPFSYDSNEYKELLGDFDKKSVGSVFINWYRKKDNAEYIDRANKIEDFFAEHDECTGIGGVKRAYEYAQFKALLSQ